MDRRDRERYALEVDLSPFERDFPKLTAPEGIGKGVEFLNRHLSARLAALGDRGPEHVFGFLRVHHVNGRSLMLNEMIRDAEGPGAGRQVTIRMTFDRSVIPEWIRQYSQHYFNRLVTVAAQVVEAAAEDGVAAVPVVETVKPKHRIQHKISLLIRPPARSDPPLPDKHKHPARLKHAVEIRLQDNLTHRKIPGMYERNHKQARLARRVLDEILRRIQGKVLSVAAIRARRHNNRVQIRLRRGLPRRRSAVTTVHPRRNRSPLPPNHRRRMLHQDQRHLRHNHRL